MEFARDASPLGDPRLQREGEFPVRLPEEELVDYPHRCENEQRAEGTKPIRLIEGRINRELRCITLLIPHPTIVAGNYPEAVMTWRKVRILHVVVVDHLSPVASWPSSLYLKCTLSGATRLSAV